MPANLTPQYREAEERFRNASSREEKLLALREMLAIIPKHKGTEKMQADLKRRLAKLEDEAAHPRKGGVQRHDPGHVPHEGAGQWVLLGAPNAGKSALVRALTHAHPEVAPYPFTTRVPLSGMMHFEDVQVQLVDTPPVADQHQEPYMVNLAHNADGVLVLLDLSGEGVEESLRAVLTILERARVWPAGRPLPAEAGPLLQVRPVVIVGTKRDLDPDGTIADLVREAAGTDLPFFAVSAERGEGLEPLRATLYSLLERIRIYAKEPGKKPDRARPFVLPRGATVHDLALAVHKDVAERLKYARIWGAARFDGQQVDREHALSDGDIVELHA
jgi:ribosome-interacting GTPase 1